MDYTERFTEGAQLLAVIHADNVTAGTTVDTGNVLLENFHRAFAVIDVGDIVATGTVDADLEQASDTTAGTRKAITGKSITQLTQAGGDSDSVAVIELRTEELDVDGGFEYINLEVTVTTAAAELSAYIYGIQPRYKPVSVTALAEVVD